MPRPTPPHTSFTWIIVLLYALDRFLKLLAVYRFFRRPPPPAPQPWPEVTLICPVTRSPNDLRRALRSRAELTYAGIVRCAFICDSADEQSQAICHEMIAAYPHWNASVVTVEPDSGSIASKIHKIQAGLRHIRPTTTILCFLDDDVTLRPDALEVLVPYVLQPDTGAAFGLACYTAWNTPAEHLMSGFVNSNALLSYVPLTYLVEPFTVTGHCFALRRHVFEAIGGFTAMEGRIDDDHELARRVRRYGLRNVQTPLIYEVENRLAQLGEYHEQMRRWMRIPRATMLPALSRRERAAMTLASVGNLLPPLLLLIALLSRRRTTAKALMINLVHFVAAHLLIEHCYLQKPMPARLWPLLLWFAWATPIHVAVAALGNRPITWRGQHLHLEQGGRFSVLPRNSPPDT